MNALLVRSMDARERAFGSSGLRLLTAISQTTKKKAVQAGRELVTPDLPKTLFVFFAKFRRNESAPLALPEWGGAHLMREASLGKSCKN